MTRLEYEKDTLASAIDNEALNFNFLIEYRELSRDQRLNRNDIQECIAKFRAYLREVNE